ncbi:hypothetical protein COCON_G00234830 [Conger conger]|uniref:Uncharacterized protein n=1 Tax=Conger conger TaxID=82655 RepID=A0A9Q1HM91_CONCO|nr:hypothetical protein COCON_G00234830 [Conger conger]
MQIQHVLYSRVPHHVCRSLLSCSHDDPGTGLVAHPGGTVGLIWSCCTPEIWGSTAFASPQVLPQKRFFKGRQMECPPCSSEYGQNDNFCSERVPDSDQQETPEHPVTSLALDVKLRLFISIAHALTRAPECGSEVAHAWPSPNPPLLTQIRDVQQILITWMGPE